MLAAGVDIVEISRIETMLERHGDRFLGRVYTDGELAYANGRLSALAARLAADLHLDQFALSLSHAADYAVAFVVAQGNGD